jgi:hypothetical protein
MDYEPDESCWNHDANRYTAHTDGIYHVSASCRINLVKAGRLMLYKNGAKVQSLFDTVSSTTSLPFYAGSTGIDLQTGDYLEIWFYSNSAVVVQPTDTNVSIHRVA